MRGRYSTEGGPPPWIPFGQKIAPMNLTDDEFEAQRRDAIAEAGRAGTAKKVFGGGGAGSRQLVDRNVQSVMEHGFTQQQAEAALKQAKNNVKKAIKNLKVIR
ncbi:hypothetical protein AAG570_005468 [Ranatra chinensis]|uniref:UBA domain-containing protein n=1 Tax=Ranatra chinensis TaxID=642074 RepID=A0ABD0XXV4_9HEMI